MQKSKLIEQFNLPAPVCRESLSNLKSISPCNMGIILMPVNLMIPFLINRLRSKARLLQKRILNNSSNFKVYLIYSLFFRGVGKGGRQWRAKGLKISASYYWQRLMSWMKSYKLGKNVVMLKQKSKASRKSS